VCGIKKLRQDKNPFSFFIYILSSHFLNLHVQIKLLNQVRRLFFHYTYFITLQNASPKSSQEDRREAD
jgi:hypothetical protein